MQVYETPSKYPRIVKRVVLTIGNFDGVHLGHQCLLKQVVNLARSLKIPSAVFTFENHPAEVINPKIKINYLTTLAHRLKLFEEIGIDYVLLRKFTVDFSKLTAEDFLSDLFAHFPFSHLILGEDALLGAQRQGDRATVKKIADQLGFNVKYECLVESQGEKVSSRRIRSLIEKGDIDKVSALLGRSFSVYGPVTTGRTHGKTIGFPTLNIHVEDLSLPPLGVYAVLVKVNGRTLKGVANLGMAPTVREDRRIILEVHLLDWEGDLYGKLVEVFFVSYIRSEQKFDNIDQLKLQIQKDIKTAKKFLK